MNAKKFTGLVALLMLAAPLAALPVGAEHAQTALETTILACTDGDPQVVDPTCVGEIDPQALAQVILDDAGADYTPGEDYVIPIDQEVLVNPLPDGPFHLDHITIQGQDISGVPDPNYLDYGDLDDDGHTDLEELNCLSNPLNPASTCADVDGDGLESTNRDGQESIRGSDGNVYVTQDRNRDTDGDNIEDQDELARLDCGYDPTDATAPKGNTEDLDNDNVPDYLEAYTNDCVYDPANLKETDPAAQDTDGDGHFDGDEVDWNKDTDEDGAINARDLDSDGDGLPDADEPDWDKDTDGDGDANMIDTDSDDDTILDGAEGTYGTSVIKADTDDDGLADGAEKTHWDDHADQDWDSDADSDGTINILDADSDDDGLLDGQEVAGWCGAYIPDALTCDAFGPYTSDAADPDSDDDGLDDKAEFDAGTNPNNADTDGDGIDDKDELDAETDPTDPTSPDPAAVDPSGDLPAVGYVTNSQCHEGEADGLIDGRCDGPLPNPLDQSDAHDNDGDGETAEPNGVPDAADLFTRIHQDDDGITLTVYAGNDLTDPFTGTPTPLLTLRVGDDPQSETVEAAYLVVYDRPLPEVGGAGTTSVCVVPGADEPISGGDGYYPESPEPCLPYCPSEDVDGDGIMDCRDGDLTDGDDADLDGDGVPNGDDNCKDVANADQDDTDGDGVGDACEPDEGGDGDDGIPGLDMLCTEMPDLCSVTPPSMEEICAEVPEACEEPQVPEDPSELTEFVKSLLLPECYSPEDTDRICYQEGYIRIRGLGYVPV